jgi:heptosyltransferase-2
MDKALPPLNEITHVVWIQTAFFGDLVLTTAAFSWVAAHFPHWKQTLITTPFGQHLLQGHPNLHHVEALNKKIPIWKEFPRIRRAIPPGKTLVLQPHRSARSSALARYLGFPTVTYEETQFSWLATVRVPRVMVLHEAYRIGLLLEPLGAKREDILSLQPCLQAPPAMPDQSQLADFFQASAGRKKIGIAPGSVWATKRWPVESFRMLTRELLQRGVDVILIGGKEEAPLAQKILRDLPQEFNSHILDATGGSLPDMRWLFSRLDLVISNDSAPIHVASAFQVPTIGIFGATVSSMGFGPLAKGSRVVELGDLPCRPCGTHGAHICPLGHFRCMKILGVPIVLKAVSPFL